MQIRNTRKLRELQREFQEVFPHLKIEFYDHAHYPGQGSPEECRLNPELQVGEVSVNAPEGKVILKGQMTTSEFEQRLRQDFGLNVQVFRRSYGKWLQTWATDVWTLWEQDRRAAEMGDGGIEIPDPPAPAHF